MAKKDTTKADGPSNDDQGSDDTRKLRKMIKNTPVAMLTTVASDGLLRSRPMATLKAPFDGHLWFLARTGAPMADEIKDNQRVGVSYASPKADRYVSVTGVATLIRDPEKIRELWSRRLRPWFPEGKKHPDLALIRVAVERADYWDAKRGIMIHLQGVVPGPGVPAVDSRKPEGGPPPTAAGSGAQA
jgi:general stress protein 26